MTTVFVDAENVRRSTWPNIAPQRLVELCRGWAATEGVVAVVVFDGRAPDTGVGEHELDERCTVVGTGAGSADDWIASAVESAEGCWLVTSDRALRERVGPAAERTIGGGAFLRLLRA